MQRQRLVLAAMLCGIGLGACRGDEAAGTKAARNEGTSPATTASATSAPAPGGHVIRHRIHPSLPEFAFTVVGDRPDESSELVRVRRIEIRSETAAEPFQIIAGLDTETPIAAGMPGLDFVDMNFDGYQDIRIVQFRPPGPNTPYLNWLFDPASGKFMENRELNDIPSPQFDAGRREIRSSWRDGATRYGTDVYLFTEGRPVLVRKEEKTYRAPGVYVLKVSQLVGGAWKTVEQHEMREPVQLEGAKQPQSAK